jgi:hypothetical protein
MGAVCVLNVVDELLTTEYSVPFVTLQCTGIYLGFQKGMVPFF